MTKNGQNLLTVRPTVYNKIRVLNSVLNGSVHGLAVLNGSVHGLAVFNGKLYGTVDALRSKKSWTVILVRTVMDAGWTLGKIGHATVTVMLPNHKNHCINIPNFMVEKILIDI